VVRELDTGNIVIKGTRTPNNLYILKGGKQQCYLNQEDENWLWHSCRIKAVHDLLDINIPEETICKPCQIGK